MDITVDQFASLLREYISTQQSNPSRSQEIANQINMIKETSTTLFLILSGQVILLPDVDDSLALVSILMIRSVLRQVRFYGIDQIHQIWESIPSVQCMQLKQALIRGLLFSSDRIRQVTSSTLALVAQLDFPDKWPDFLDILEKLFQQREQYGPGVVKGILEVLSEAFTSSNFIRPRYISLKNNALRFVCTICFTALQSEYDCYTKKLAVLLLVNSFKTTFHRLFKDSNELRMSTAQLLLECMKINDEELHGMICQFFAVMFKLLYDVIFPDPITDILSAVTMDLQSNDPAFQKIALVFLKKCAKEEIQNFKKKGRRPGGDYSDNDYKFTKLCAMNFTAPIMPLLANINEIDVETFDMGDSLHEYVYKVLKTFSEIAGEHVFHAVQSFYSQYFGNNDWHFKCAAILALKTVVWIGKPVVEYMQSVVPEIASLAGDPNPTVCYFALNFIASFIKVRDITILPDPLQEVEFIVTFSVQLLKSNSFHAKLGCSVIQNFAQRYRWADVKSPLSDNNIFSTLLQNLWVQFNREDVFSTRLYNFVSSSINQLITSTPYSTTEIRRRFCIEVLNKFQETIQSDGRNITDKSTLQSTLLNILGTVIFSLRGIENFQLTNQIFSVLFPLLPNANSIENLILTLGNLIISSKHEYAKGIADKLVPFLLQAQHSSDQQLINESAVIIGDLYRITSDVMKCYAIDFGNVLLSNIENDDLQHNAVCQQIMSLADLVMNTGDVTFPLRDRMMIVVRNFTHIRFNPDDKSDVKYMTDYLEGIIYLSGAILQAFSRDSDFITNKENLNILLEFRKFLKPEVFKSDQLDTSFLLFLDAALKNKEAARKYNILINHYNIMSYLQKIINQSHNNSNIEKAKEMQKNLSNA